MNITTPGAAAPDGNRNDHDYHAFLQRLQARYDAHIAGGQAVFTTSASGADLWEVYLSGFASGERQHHNCRACRHFIERFGNLATVSEQGVVTPLFWDETDAGTDNGNSIAQICRIVRRAHVTGVFLSSEACLGTGLTGIWRHLSITQSREVVCRETTQTASQKMAEKLEDYRNVCRALAEINPKHLEQALQLLRSDALFNSPAVLGQAQFLADLHTRRAGLRGAQRDNATWLMIAKAPAGFCHPRSSMIGSLLEDLAAGLPFADVERKFRAKMRPDVYQRPQAAPTAGAVAQAEKIFEKLRAGGSLRRRYARLEDMQLLWQPKADQKPEPKGLFGNLPVKGIPSDRDVQGLYVPAATPITWGKFSRTVLPGLTSLEILVPHSGNFYGATTAVDPGAPPILQWDSENVRNPVSGYIYVHGSSASQWGLVGGTYAEVTGVSLKSSMWNGGQEHHGKGVQFIIKGAKDSNRSCGSALFPATLRAEFHGIRSVMESYSNRTPLEGRDDQTANGLFFTENSPVTVRCKQGGVEQTYKIDRWD